MTAIILSASARTEMLRAARDRPEIETGGILVGHYQGTDIIVRRAVEVRDPHATGSAYELHAADAQRALDEDTRRPAAKETDGYVGEWHSHPARLPPSKTDKRALSKIALRSARRPVLIVCHAGDEPEFWGLEAGSRLRPHRPLAVISTVGRLLSRVGRLPATAVRADGPTFISYRQSDGTPRADDLEALLRASGVVVWRDHDDLGAGNTDERLERALTQGLGSAVLIVTPDIAYSDVVKNRELPRLLQLDDHREFELTIANEIPGHRSSPDYSAPDRLLDLAPDQVLGNKKQENSTRADGRRAIVKDVVRHRFESRRHTIASNRTVDVVIQTRSATTVLDDDIHSDLCFRIDPPDGKVPEERAVQALETGLPLASDAAYAAGARHLKVAGGAHLSLALALGAAFPETRFGKAEVTDGFDKVWLSPADEAVTIPNAEQMPVSDADPRRPVAVQVALTPQLDPSGFKRLIETERFSAAYRIAPVEGRIDEHKGAALARAIADELKQLCRRHNTAELHLAFQGPFAMAVLLGRLLNTLSTTAYEWNDDDPELRWYQPVVVLRPGVDGASVQHISQPEPAAEAEAEA
ncbi:SAVED domain-containing protein [Curtobacterium flaccumfaciens]|uniref:SAVED domain-containing protein n=1 Tax=Curtobacterium flaccumfaciens TaxID=2035 RepID=UPI001BDED003|nr:SAVED domain-containing protein [Curtobacterium flaccumfaciens]MBT1606487.1 SAVED domain-containing protein [Curtobacterium flaccumfaciens pv. betae]MBT1655961.1 SAVED domain-containing protein [Curtobacterium flaccumfaciens pv. betae]MCS0471731.1 SAVED domain-containing protein [Curtobacterium flaccumfaciens pv. betae]MCS0473486.1 SAVED domain-containing protein [Curtobacterium flaccumfaciens pv. betae]MCS0477825.1 SAVED domain-containing protein [Curtobacterium flaccumfaciens pv. betae]